ncbi:DEAD/DEAH box helicase [Guptibacillus hwajinpoensis]|uniref:DEAD/DEAH box helicase n=1 Tax=Guptibacillus hwajinpoensis TaxID=208199 RepID=UPI0024B32DA0|nr:DEAD/DEAH box helicase [Pseudalkalibacillus hwajinpoensis]
MAFKKRKKPSINFDTPQAMFRDIKNREVDGLLDHQSDMIDAYLKEMDNKKDIAFELPTGSGKTLVGLLIGEWRRRINNEKVVYLCPTKQLVNQVVEQSKQKYGIKTLAFTGSKRDYSPRDIAFYTRGEAVAVCTYNSLFNTNTFFEDPDLIIVDDAHSAENYIPSFYSLEIDREENSTIYHTLVELLKSVVPNHTYQRMKNEYIYPEDLEWVDKLPLFKLHELTDQLIPLLDEYTKDGDLRFSWSMLRDNMHACNVFISWKNILIRPLVPPTLTFAPFANAKQRIYMSATLGNTGDLERSLGIPNIQRLPIPDGWDKQGIGRRLFFFPEAMADKETVQEITIDMIKKVDRALILAPNDYSAQEIRENISSNTNYSIFSAQELEISKSGFTSTDNAVAILANRFDGIDLSDEDCRLLIVNGLPRATHIQEKFFMSRMAASLLFHDRIRTRLVQAIGRCTRGATDYSAVCILSQGIINQLIPSNKIKYFHPELQAEILFGHDESLHAEDKNDLLENLDIFLEHGDEWDEVDELILEQRNQCDKETDNASSKLQSAAVDEVQFVYALWKKDFDNCMVHIGDILTKMSGDETKGYRGFWYYMAGATAWLASKNGIDSYEKRVGENLRKASRCTNSVTWFNEFIPEDKESSMGEDPDLLVSQVEMLEFLFDRLGIASDNKFNRKIKEAQTFLSERNYNNFENGHEILGMLLGFKSSNTDQTGGPDPWWIVDNKVCLVFEDKFHVDPQKPLSVSEVKQAKGHKDWIRKNISDFRDDGKIITVFITNITNIDDSALPFTEDLYYWNVDDFLSWSYSAIEVIRKVRKRFNEPGDLIFRSEAIEILQGEGLDIMSVISKVKNYPLNKIKSE